jgi:hypothetical protein
MNAELAGSNKKAPIFGKERDCQIASSALQLGLDAQKTTPRR